MKPRTISKITVISVVYRQRKYRWFWEAFYQPNIRPGWSMTVTTADHEGEDQDQFNDTACDCAAKIGLLELEYDGYRDFHWCWLSYGKTDDYPYMHSIGHLTWLDLPCEIRDNGLVCGKWPDNAEDN